jgi:hypothetical protein
VSLGCLSLVIVQACFQSLSLREAAPCAATKQSSWIAEARFAHLR